MAIPLKYNLRNLIVRRVNTLMTIGTIALVVGIFVALMSLANGLNIALRATGAPENLIILRQGSQTEMQSAVTKEAFQVIQTLPGIARDQQGKPRTKLGFYGGVGGMMRLTPFGGQKAKVTKALEIMFQEGVIAFYCGHDPYHIRFLPPVGVMKPEQFNDVFAILETALAKVASAK